MHENLSEIVFLHCFWYFNRDAREQVFLKSKKSNVQNH